VDPASARRLHANDVKRVVRALEVYARLGKPISELQRQWDDTPRNPHRMMILCRSAEDLRARVSRRVRQMFSAGLVREVGELLRRPGRLGPAARSAVGYKEVADYLERGGELEDVVGSIEKRTWQVVRKQLTWLRRFRRAMRLKVGPQDFPEKIAQALYKSLLKWHNLAPR